ncbi:hypothetical protein M2281_002520 [Mesorhizobium soli]|uniref:hypothetical protein n=1 Tax=Pseudaminobacter soli (ex Li et al. 2025) TaxID=1295366 RepID=UPI0024736A11|nr:hypothetical protein [Mesorhizobium soli]MDH6231922.1 hypothetical protein [Mesorhizobium soli]
MRLIPPRETRRQTPEEVAPLTHHVCPCRTSHDLQHRFDLYVLLPAHSIGKCELVDRLDDFVVCPAGGTHVVDQIIQRVLDRLLTVDIPFGIVFLPFRRVDLRHLGRGSGR